MTLFLSISIYASSNSIIFNHSFDSNSEESKQQDNSDLDDDFFQSKDFCLANKTPLILTSIIVLQEIKFYFMDILPTLYFIAPTIKPPDFSV